MHVKTFSLYVNKMDSFIFTFVKTGDILLCLILISFQTVNLKTTHLSIGINIGVIFKHEEKKYLLLWHLNMVQIYKYLTVQSKIAILT